MIRLGQSYKNTLLLITNMIKNMKIIKTEHQIGNQVYSTELEEQYCLPRQDY